MKWINHSLFIVFFLAFFFVGSAVCAYDDDNTRGTLQGFDSVWVYLDEIAPEIKKAGLTVDQLRTDSEKKLRSAGIKVLTQEEWKKTEQAPMLAVIYTIASASDGYLFNLHLHFYQEALLVHSRIHRYVSTWSVGGAGIAPDFEFIRNFLKDEIDQFINAWLSVNPKK